MALTQGNAFLGKYGAELIQTANALVAEGKGILAADESTGTVGKRVRFRILMEPSQFVLLCDWEGEHCVLGLLRELRYTIPKPAPFYLACCFDDHASVISCHHCVELSFILRNGLNVEACLCGVQMKEGAVHPLHFFAANSRIR
jgi:hypothetical protein